MLLTVVKMILVFSTATIANQTTCSARCGNGRPQELSSSIDGKHPWTLSCQGATINCQPKIKDYHQGVNIPHYQDWQQIGTQCTIFGTSELPAHWYAHCSLTQDNINGVCSIDQTLPRSDGTDGCNTWVLADGEAINPTTVSVPKVYSVNVRLDLA